MLKNKWSLTSSAFVYLHVVYRENTILSDLLYFSVVAESVKCYYGSVYCVRVGVAWGTRWRSWLRRCATSQKVAGSIPDGVIGIFH